MDFIFLNREGWLDLFNFWKLFDEEGDFMFQFILFEFCVSSNHIEIVLFNFGISIGIY